MSRLGEPPNSVSTTLLLINSAEKHPEFPRNLKITCFDINSISGSRG